ncbi:extensin-like [Dermochelys coriacea]|uniref:extensin-like n=1 Tax=Dermochelys coriacea TaxID=27794 RepID=UPI001CA8FFC0|nr:extensin-like [Dermochelys coriacea]
MAALTLQSHPASPGAAGSSAGFRWVPPPQSAMSRPPEATNKSVWGRHRDSIPPLPTASPHQQLQGEEPDGAWEKVMRAPPPCPQPRPSHPLSPLQSCPTNLVPHSNLTNHLPSRPCSPPITFLPAPTPNHLPSLVPLPSHQSPSFPCPAPIPPITFLPAPAPHQSPSFPHPAPIPPITFLPAPAPHQSPSFPHPAPIPPITFLPTPTPIPPITFLPSSRSHPTNHLPSRPCSPPITFLPSSRSHPTNHLPQSTLWVGSPFPPPPAPALIPGVAPSGLGAFGGLRPLAPRLELGAPFLCARRHV